MRVYELAKELGVGSKDLLAALKEGGFPATSHMTVLTDQGQNFLAKRFSSKSTKKETKTVAAKAQKAAAPVAAAKVKPAAPAIKPPPALTAVKPKEPVKIEKQPVTAPSRVVQPTSVQPSSKENKPDMQKSVQSRGPQSEKLHKPAPFVPPVVEEDEEIAEELLAEEAPTESFEVHELREQERVKKLLQTTGLPSAFLGQLQPQVRRRRRRRRQPRVVHQEAPKKAVTEASIDKSMMLFEVADFFGKQSSELILALLKKGMVVNRNNLLTLDVIKSLAQQFNIALNTKSAVPESSAALRKDIASAKGTTRWPVVVVMGHVDHGKTTLLDYVRKMNVAATEKGGITQHLRAWEVDSTHGKIVFLDTPGHEAFSYMRERGSKITDIVVLVVAVDDGIKPQTLEAIKHAKAAQVPIVVAVNKIDKMSSPSALETVKRQLAQHELMPEEWGGDTIVAPISAKTGQGVDKLLEMIVLQSQLLDLKADINSPAKAFVLESHVEKGFGPVATALCTQGTLKTGDYFISGNSTGKVRILIDSHGKKIAQAAPSIPVQIVGFDNFAGIGDWISVVPQQEYLKARSQRMVEAPLATNLAPNMQTVQASKDTRKFINLIVKTDTRGSKEAVMDSIDKVSKQYKEIKCPIYIVSSGIGDINESDIELAASTKSIILALHVRVEKNAQLLAKDKEVNVQNFGIIYEMIDYLGKLILSKKEAVYTWNKVGEAVVRKVFDIKGQGIIAGCYMKDGVLARGNKVECVRKGTKIGEAKVVSLQRDRKPVKEIHAGYECGFTAEGFQEWQEGDTVVVYAEVKEKSE